MIRIVRKAPQVKRNFHLHVTDFFLLILCVQKKDAERAAEVSVLTEAKGRFQRL